MLKTGIHTTEDFVRKVVNGRFSGRQIVSVGLYDELQESGREDADELQGVLLRRYATGTGTFKRTYRDRFREFDRRVVPLIGELAKEKGRCRVHDLGVSDGRTAFDFFSALSDSGTRGLEFLASDFAPYATIISDPSTRLSIALGHQEELTQVVWPPFVFSVPRRESRLLYPLNALILDTLLRTSVPRLISRYEDGDETIHTRRVTLICGALSRLVKDDPRVDFMQYDVMKPSDRRFDIVRAMNVLNQEYFSDEQLKVALRNIRDSLEDGGVFVTGKNESPDSQVAGGVYKKERNGSFVELSSLGERTPIHDLIVALDS